MNYALGIVLGHFYCRSRYHYLAGNRPQHSPHNGSACGRSTSWNDSGRAYQFPFPLWCRTHCQRGIDPLVVLSHPRPFLHIPAQCSQGAPACKDWTIRDRPAPIVHGRFSAAHRGADLARIADFMAQNLRGFRDHTRIENVRASMADGRHHNCASPLA